MSEVTKSAIWERILQRLPYPDQIRAVDLTHDTDVRFAWRGDRFRVGSNFDVDEVGDGVLIGSNISILLGALLKRR